MIRPLEEKDWDKVIDIVIKSWQTIYRGYLNPALFTEAGLREQRAHLQKDFASRRLEESVWEEQGQILGLLSMGDTADADKPGAFEVWRIYLSPEARGKGIGGQLLAYAEDRAREQGCREAVIWAFRENTRAIAFYQKHGYRPDKEEYLGEPYLAYGVRLTKML